MVYIKFFDRKFFKYAVSLGLRRYPEVYFGIPVTIFVVGSVFYKEYYIKNVIGTFVSQYKNFYFIYRQGDIETYLYPESYITDKNNLLPDHPKTGNETLKNLPKIKLDKKPNKDFF